MIEYGHKARAFEKTGGEGVIGCIVLGAIFYVISFILLSMYVEGDQVHYHRFYDLIRGVPFVLVAPIARSVINSGEPVSWFVLWVGSNLGIPKNHWVSVLNVLLALGLCRLFRRFKAPWYAVVLILTNFYFVVLMTGAERLKIAYIILIFAFLARGKLRVILVLLSPAAHFQSLIFLISVILTRVAGDVRRLWTRFSVRKKALLLSGYSVLFLGGFLGVFYGAIQRKAIGYVGRDVSGLEILNILLLSVVTLWVTRQRLKLIIALTPLYFATLLLGGQRVNMIAVTFVLGFLLFEQRLSHPLVLILLAFFSFKTIPFVLNIYLYGNGFGGPLW